MQLTSDEGKSDEQRRLDYIEAAEIKQIIGDLKGAAELFKKASLTVKGKKDFESLYRAAVLNIEMAFFREAEADLRAILTFSDDIQLRIKSNIQNARIEKFNGNIENARQIMTEILSSSVYIPPEAVYFASELFSDEEIKKLTASDSLIKPSEEYLAISRMLNPETVFGSFEDYTSPDEKEESIEDSENLNAAGIQLGSFSVKENAADLKKTLENAGYVSSIKVKIVNGKQYFSVTVSVPEDKSVQKMIIELKEKGFEGYPVY